MALLSREEILAAADLPTEDVPVPEWGGSVRIRTLTGRERDAFEASCGDRAEGQRNFRARLCAWSMVDEMGVQLFTTADVEALGEKSGVALDRVFEAVRKLSRIALPEEAEEELEKNFAPAPPVFSGSN